MTHAPVRAPVHASVHASVHVLAHVRRQVVAQSPRVGVLGIVALALLLATPDESAALAVVQTDPVRNSVALTSTSISITFDEPVDVMSNRIAGEQTRIYGAAVMDFNGDQYVDLATINEVSEDVRVCLNRSDGTGLYGPFLAPHPIGLEASPNEPADFDNDGDLDFGLTDEIADVVILMENEGPATAAPDALDGPHGTVGDTGSTRLVNHPDPFVSETRLRFESAARGPALIEVFDPIGRLVARRALAARVGVNEVQFDGRAESGRRLEAGVYLYTLRVGPEGVGASARSGRMTIVR